MSWIGTSPAMTTCPKAPSRLRIGRAHAQRSPSTLMVPPSPSRSPTCLSTAVLTGRRRHGPAVSSQPRPATNTPSHRTGARDGTADDARWAIWPASALSVMTIDNATSPWSLASSSCSADASGPAWEVERSVVRVHSCHLLPSPSVPSRGEYGSCVIAQYLLGYLAAIAIAGSGGSAQAGFVGTTIVISKTGETGTAEHQPRTGTAERQRTPPTDPGIRRAGLGCNDAPRQGGRDRGTGTCDRSGSSRWQCGAGHSGRCRYRKDRLAQ